MIRLCKAVRSSRQKLFVWDKTIWPRKTVYLLESPFFFFKDHSWSHIPKWKLRKGRYLIGWKVVDYESKNWPNKKIEVGAVYLQKLFNKINKPNIEKINYYKNKIKKPFNRFINWWWRNIMQYLRSEIEVKRLRSERLNQKTLANTIKILIVSILETIAVKVIQLPCCHPVKVKSPAKVQFIWCKKAWGCWLKRSC